MIVTVMDVHELGCGLCDAGGCAPANSSHREVAAHRWDTK